MNFSGIPNRTILGKILRVPLGFIPKEMTVPIIQGPLRGRRWIAGSSNHGCWLGSYEYEKQKVFIKRVKPGDVVFDIGANVGFYTLLASVLVENEGKVIAFEPLPRNLVYLDKHMKMNHCLNVDVLPYAVSDCEMTAEFAFSKNPSMGHLCTKGDITVQTVLIDNLIESKKLFPPDVMKIDVEGAELSVLRGSHHVIKGKRPIIFVATHGISAHRDCLEFLRSLDYHLTPIGHSSIENCDEIIAEPF
jgi:FkbM family methyltransferase